MAEITRLGTITCPYCRYRKTMRMEEESCTVRYMCPGCRTVLWPKEGDCCVFCSYGNVPCPPVQRELEALQEIYDQWDR